MRKVLVLATSCLLMTSCVIDKRELVSEVDQYNKEFVSVFGETDPNHTWCMVENKKVEVNLNKPSQVKVYVKAGQNYHLAADYENVSGKQQLSFDAPMGCKDVYVTVDGVPYQGAGSRADTAIDPSLVVTAMTENGKPVYVHYKFGEIKKFKDDATTLPEQINNMDKVTMDYEVISNGLPYKFYPLFWNADYEHTFGVYYYEGESTTPKEVVFYTDKMEGDNCYLQYKNSEGKWIDVISDYAYEDIFAQENLTDDSEVLRGRYFTINLPQDTKFGFFVNVSEEGRLIGKYYSNPALNEPHKSFSSFSYLETGKETEYAKTYITIEDHTNLDFDHNDFIFIMEGTQNHITNDPVEYIYAVEDLGNKDDFDFNDVVFSVSHVSGQPHANVKLLAAGGTLPAWICFDGTFDETFDETNFSFTGMEVHEMFGVETNVMVNTQDVITKPAKSFVVQVPAGWSHANHDFTTQGNGFNVKVQNDGNVTTATPGNNTAPQILILPDNWLWPTERTRIDAAYPSFGEWGENYTNSTWVKNRDYSKVVDWVGTQN